MKEKMADISSSLQSSFLIFSLISVIVYFLIRVSIQAEILRYFTKKYQLSPSYGKAWLTILIPSIIISLISIPLVLLGLPSFLTIVLWLVFFPILILSINLIYKTSTQISAKVSLKIFMLSIILILLVAGLQTLREGINDPLDSRMSAGPGCTTDCEFRYPLGSDINSAHDGVRDVSEGDTPLIIKGYDSSELIVEKTFSLGDLNLLKTGETDGIGFKLVEGKLDSTGCRAMEFTRIDGGSSKNPCNEPKKGFIHHVKKVLIG